MPSGSRQADAARRLGAGRALTTMARRKGAPSSGAKRSAGRKARRRPGGAPAWKGREGLPGPPSRTSRRPAREGPARVQKPGWSGSPTPIRAAGRPNEETTDRHASPLPRDTGRPPKTRRPPRRDRDPRPQKASAPHPQTERPVRPLRRAGMSGSMRAVGGVGDRFCLGGSAKRTLLCMCLHVRLALAS